MALSSLMVGLAQTQKNYTIVFLHGLSGFKALPFHVLFLFALLWRCWCACLSRAGAATPTFAHRSKALFLSCVGAALLERKRRSASLLGARFLSGEAANGARPLGRSGGVCCKSPGGRGVLASQDYIPRGGVRKKTELMNIIFGPLTLNFVRKIFYYFTALFPRIFHTFLFLHSSPSYWSRGVIVQAFPARGVHVL